MSANREIKTSGVPTITKKHIQDALKAYSDKSWKRKFPCSQAGGQVRLKEFLQDLPKNEEQVPSEKMMDLVTILAQKTLSIEYEDERDAAAIAEKMRFEFKSLEEKFGRLWPILKFYTTGWVLVFGGIYEDLPILYQYPEYAFDLVHALKVMVEYQQIYKIRPDQPLVQPHLEMRQQIYSHPKQANAFTRLVQYRLYHHSYNDPEVEMRVELLFSLIDKGRVVVEIMRLLKVAKEELGLSFRSQGKKPEEIPWLLREAKIDIADKYVLIKQNAPFFNHKTINMLEELSNAKLFVTCFDTLIAHAQYSDQILNLWLTKEYPVTKEGFDKILLDVKTKILSVEKHDLSSGLLNFGHFNKPPEEEEKTVLPKIVIHKRKALAQEEVTELPSVVIFKPRRPGKQ